MNGLVILFYNNIALRPAEIKASYAVAYADCFAAALALSLGVPVVTGDPEFKKIEALVAVDWLPYNQEGGSVHEDK